MRLEGREVPFDPSLSVECTRPVTLEAERHHDVAVAVVVAAAAFHQQHQQLLLPLLPSVMLPGGAPGT